MPDKDIYYIELILQDKNKSLEKLKNGKITINAEIKFDTTDPFAKAKKKASEVSTEIKKSFTELQKAAQDTYVQIGKINDKLAALADKTTKAAKAQKQALKEQRDEAFALAKQYESMTKSAEAFNKVVNSANGSFNGAVNRGRGASGSDFLPPAVTKQLEEFASVVNGTFNGATVKGRGVSGADFLPTFKKVINGASIYGGSLIPEKVYTPTKIPEYQRRFEQELAQTKARLEAEKKQVATAIEAFKQGVGFSGIQRGLSSPIGGSNLIPGSPAYLAQQNKNQFTLDKLNFKARTYIAKDINNKALNSLQIAKTIGRQTAVPIDKVGEYFKLYSQLPASIRYTLPNGFDTPQEVTAAIKTAKEYIANEQQQAKNIDKNARDIARRGAIPIAKINRAKDLAGRLGVPLTQSFNSVEDVDEYIRGANSTLRAQTSARTLHGTERQRIAKANLELDRLDRDELTFNNGQEVNKIASRFGVSPSKLNTRDAGRLFRASRLTNPETVIQLGFAGAFGGVPSLVGATLGGLTKAGPGGAVFGSTFTQALIAQIFDPAVQVFKQFSEEFKEAGLAFNRSILGIAAVNQANTTFVGAGGSELPISKQLSLQSDLAKNIQLKARKKLLPLGIAGQTEATFVQGLVSALSQRGINASPEEISRIAELLGGSIQAQRPALLDNTQLLLRDIQDVFGGGAQANRTILSQLIRPSLGGIIQAKSGKDIIRSLEKGGAQGFVDAATKLDNPIVLQNKLAGQLDLLKTNAGIKLLDALTPSIKRLLDTLDDESDSGKKIGELTDNLGKSFGLILGAVVDFQSSLLQKASEFKDQIVPLTEAGLQVGETSVDVSKNFLEFLGSGPEGSALKKGFKQAAAGFDALFIKGRREDYLITKQLEEDREKYIKEREKREGISQQQNPQNIANSALVNTELLETSQKFDKGLLDLPTSRTELLRTKLNELLSTSAKKSFIFSPNDITESIFNKESIEGKRIALPILKAIGILSGDLGQQRIEANSFNKELNIGASGDIENQLLDFQNKGIEAENLQSQQDIIQKILKSPELLPGEKAGYLEQSSRALKQKESIDALRSAEDLLIESRKRAQEVEVSLAGETGATAESRKRIASGEFGSTLDQFKTNKDAIAKVEADIKSAQASGQSTYFLEQRRKNLILDSTKTNRALLPGIRDIIDQAGAAAENNSGARFLSRSGYRDSFEFDRLQLESQKSGLLARRSEINTQIAGAKAAGLPDDVVRALAEDLRELDAKVNDLNLSIKKTTDEGFNVLNQRVKASTDAFDALRSGQAFEYAQRGNLLQQANQGGKNLADFRFGRRLRELEGLTGTIGKGEEYYKLTGILPGNLPSEALSAITNKSFGKDLQRQLLEEQIAADARNYDKLPEQEKSEEEKLRAEIDKNVDALYNLTDATNKLAEMFDKANAELFGFNDFRGADVKDSTSLAQGDTPIDNASDSPFNLLKSKIRSRLQTKKPYEFTIGGDEIKPQIGGGEFGLGSGGSDAGAIEGIPFKNNQEGTSGDFLPGASGKYGTGTDYAIGAEQGSVLSPEALLRGAAMFAKLKGKELKETFLGGNSSKDVYVKSLKNLRQQPKDRSSEDYTEDELDYLNKMYPSINQELGAAENRKLIGERSVYAKPVPKLNWNIENKNLSPIKNLFGNKPLFDKEDKAKESSEVRKASSGDNISEILKDIRSYLKNLDANSVQTQMTRSLRSEFS